MLQVQYMAQSSTQNEVVIDASMRTKKRHQLDAHLAVLPDTDTDTGVMTKLTLARKTWLSKLFCH